MTKPQPQETAVSDTAGIRVFVYGTLKRWHYNHQTLNPATSIFLGACQVKGAIRMLNLGHFPGVQRTVDPHINNVIYGEVYRVTPETLRALDILEGNGRFFTREQIETPWKKAWMYMIPASYANRPIIGEGVWKPQSLETTFIHSGKPFMEAQEYLDLAQGT